LIVEGQKQETPGSVILEQGDRALLNEVRSGSTTAFDELMKRYQRPVYAICLVFATTPEDALDMTQDVFVKVYQKLDSFRGRGTFKAWVFRIAHNEGLNRARDRSRHGDHLELTPANSPPVGPNQVADLARKERQNLLREALLHLSPRQRQAVTLRYFEKMPIRDIASILDCTDGTAKNLLFRSLQMLRAHLAPYWREV
jgi:RNA polymerase sigma-70 factor (ECF subfamily)